MDSIRSILQSRKRQPTPRVAALQTAAVGSDPKDDGPIHVPVRKVLHQAMKKEQYKGALVFLAYTTVYAYRCTYRIDWPFAQETFRIMEAATDNLDGISLADNVYCNKDSDSFYWYDTSTDDQCRFEYKDVGEITELESFLAMTLLPLPDKIDGVCVDCAMAMTGAVESLRQLDLSDCEPSHHPAPASPSLISLAPRANQLGAGPARRRDWSEPHILPCLCRYLLGLPGPRRA